MAHTAVIDVYGTEAPWNVLHCWTKHTGDFSLRVNCDVGDDRDHEIALAVNEDQLDKIVVVTPDGNTHRLMVAD